MTHVASKNTGPIQATQQRRADRFSPWYLAIAITYLVAISALAGAEFYFDSVLTHKVMAAAFVIVLQLIFAVAALINLVRRRWRVFVSALAGVVILIPLPFGVRWTPVTVHKIQSVEQLGQFFDLSIPDTPVRDRRFELVCLTLEYRGVFEQIRETLAAGGHMQPSDALRGADGLNEIDQGEYENSLVLLSKHEAVLLRLDYFKNVEVAAAACADAAAPRLHIEHSADSSKISMQGHLTKMHR